MRLNFLVPFRPGSCARLRPRLAAALLLGAALGVLPAFAAIASAPASAASGIQAQPVLVRTLEDIREYRLPNGLQILLVPDASKPVVAVQLTVRAGSLQDPLGASGAMHLLEHLMFGPRQGQASAHAAIAQRGIRANAITAHDRTTFTANFAADPAVQRWYLGWLAEAFANGALTQEDVRSAMGPVRNEMQGAQTFGLGVAIDTALWGLYAGQGYGRAPIGRLPELESIDAAHLAALHARYYRPDNATLVVTGAFDPDDTLRSIAQGFGAVAKPAEPLPVATNAVQEWAGAQSLVVQRPAVGPMVMVAAPGPSARDADAPAARLLAYALTRDPSGLLNRRLVDGGIAARVLGQARTQAAGGTLLFAAQPAAGQDPAAVAQALRQALADAATLTPEQVELARYGWMAEWRRRFNDPERLADDLSEAAGRGDWRMHLADYAAIRSLTREDLRRVASQWLGAPLVLSLLPASAPPPAAAPSAPLVLPEQGAGGKRAVAVSAPSAADALPRPQTRTLADGRLALSVLRRPQRGGAVVARLAIPMLPANASQEQTRAAGLLAAMLGTYRGTAEGADAFQFALDRIETAVSVGFFSQELLIDINTSADRFDDAMARVRTLLASERFQQELLDVEKRKWRGRLDRAAQDPPARLGELLARHGSPYGTNDVRYVPSIEEEVASLDRVGLVDIAQARAALLPLRGARIAVVGDLDPAAVAAALERHLKPLLATDRSRAPQMVEDQRQAPPPANLLWRATGGDGAFLSWAAFLPLREGERDALALALGNRIFGQQGSGRLWRRLREREALSYGAWSEIDWNATAPSSSWRASASFAPGDLRRVEAALREELRLAAREGFTAEELAQAKAGYLQEQRRFRGQPGRLLSRQLHALRTGAPAIDDASEAVVTALGLDEVNAAWRRYIREEQLVRALAGNLPEDAAAASAAP
jgi:zinc protease